jgi:hypothetical protein
LVIADLGSPPWNDNVLMEIGSRLAIGRPIVFFADIEPKPKKLPLHLQHRQILSINSDEPTEDNIQQLCKYIKGQQGRMYGWRSDYPIVEFRVPLNDPDAASFIYANQAAAELYGVDDPEELLEMSVSDADDKLKSFMPDGQREAFHDDQVRLFGIILAPGSRSPAMARVPAWLLKHAKSGQHNTRLYWPILLQHKSYNSPPPDQDNSIVMRVAFVDVSEWDAHGPDSRDSSSVVKIPNIFRDRRFKYDVFLSYNSQDHEIVRELAVALRRFGLHVWLDEDNLSDQRGLVAALKRAMFESRIIAAVIGKNGLGLWQEEVELQGALLKILRGTGPFVLLLLNDVTVENNHWLQHVPIEYRDVLQNRQYVQLPNLDELRSLINDDTRLLEFVKRMVRLLAHPLHLEEHQG